MVQNNFLHATQLCFGKCIKIIIIYQPYVTVPGKRVLIAQIMIFLYRRFSATTPKINSRDKTFVFVSEVSPTLRPNDFPFQNWPISVSHFNKFHLTANFYRFRCLLAMFHTKIMLVLYDIGLFFNSTICGVTLNSKRLEFQSHVLTGSSASKTPNSISVSGENGKSLALHSLPTLTLSLRGWKCF